MNIGTLDLNLLRVLRAVLEEGSTTRAAARLHVTQSAVSNALARLRQALGDPLFVRTGRGLAPTPRALALRPVVIEALDRLEQALGQAFDPATTERTFTLACSDHHAAADVPRLAVAFAAALPRACLRVVSVDFLLSTDGLASGTVDAALAPAEIDGAGLRSLPLFREAATLVVRRDHPTVRAQVTIEELNALGHVDVHVALGSPGQVHRKVEAALEALGLKRRVALVVPSFTAAATVAARTDLVAWMPAHAARLFTEALPLRTVGAPWPALEAACVLVWHERTHADPGAAFFRELVVGVLREPR